MKSHWTMYVESLAYELLDNEDIDFDMSLPIEPQVLNGAPSWKEYSWGGCGTIYDTDIAAQACTNGEWKKTKGGQKDPNTKEQWLDVQARGYWQAAQLLKELQGENKTVKEMLSTLEASAEFISKIANERTEQA